MVDIGQQTLQLIKGSMTSTCMGIEFAPDSQAYVAGWRNNTDLSANTYDVYSHNGQLITSFIDAPACCDPSWVHVAGDRFAIAQAACFRVYDTSSGLLLTTAGPDPLRHVIPSSGSGQVAVSPSGSKLAFCPAVTLGTQLTVHIYDARTWQQVACLQAGAGAASIEPRACNSLTSEMFWGTHGWMLSYFPGPDHELGRLQILAPRADKFQQAGLHSGCEACQSLALSPCGSFVLLCEPRDCAQGAILEVRDVRTGELVLSHASGLSRDASTNPALQFEVILRWSSCGSRLTAMIRVEHKGDQPKIWVERILFVQLM